MFLIRKNIFPGLQKNLKIAFVNKSFSFARKLLIRII